MLEITEPGTKKTTDAQICTWRELFSELEDEGHTEVTVNSHDISRASTNSDDASVWDINYSKIIMVYDTGVYG